MTSSTAQTPLHAKVLGRISAFTLIELILVMALLAIAGGLVGARFVHFFQGRTLTIESQRLLSLAHYGQSRAVSEGMPVALMLNQNSSVYSLSLVQSYASDDSKAVSYKMDDCIKMTVQASTESEQSYASYGSQLSHFDTKKTQDANQLRILFLADGTIDDTSPSRVVLTHENGDALQLVLKDRRIGYEILPSNENTQR